MKWTRPLCGPAAMSQNDCKTSETIPPQEASPVKHPINVLGIDIAKRILHVVGLDERGQIVLPDISHRLAHFHEYSTIKSRIRFAEKLKQLLMLLSEMHPQGVPLPRDAAHMNPDKVLEYPACCRMLHQLALLVGKRRVMVLERLTDTGL
jgi:hypothetical protein